MGRRSAEGLALLLIACSASTLASDRPAPSEICGDCHVDIYRAWTVSAHATTMAAPFLDAYQSTDELLGDPVSSVCLECHAPLRAAVNDRELIQQITWEGVNCEFCHSLAEVDLDESWPHYRLEIGPIKRGPIVRASSDAHAVAYSELHNESRVCAPCHEYVNPEGTPVMTTFSEWSVSSFASRGKTCQGCHMPVVMGDVVDPKVKRSQRAMVNLHEMPGGHSLEQLHKALRLRIKPERHDDRLVVTVSVRNKGAGHAVPTGMPGRRVMLNVKVTTSDGLSFEETRTFSKTFKDADGNIVGRDSDYFSRGIRLVEDTRIGVDETRDEVFDFGVPSTDKAYLEVRLSYEHAPHGDDRDRTLFTFLSEKRLLKP
jgi:hypothetical protein